MAPKHPKSSKPPSRSTRTAQNPTQAQLVQLQPTTQSPAETQNPRAPSPIRKSKRVKKVSFKNRSATWKDYNAYKDVKGLKMAECIHCGGILRADPTKNGISSLGRHTLSCQKKRLEAENSGQMRLNFQSSTDGTMSLGNWKFDQMTVRKTVVEMIILDELPFRFVEKQGFNRVMAAACPMFKMPCRKTVREDCLKLFLEEKERLRTYFSSKCSGRVSLTTDCWTSIQNFNYLCLTAHFIETDGTKWKEQAMSTTVENKLITLISSDDQIFEVEESVAKESQTIKHMIEDDCAGGDIPLPNVESKILAKVIEYCKKHIETDAAELKQWDEDFAKVDHAILFDLILAANYLDIKGLLDLTCQTVADMIKGKSPEEIRTMFNIKNDFTPEKKKEVRRKNQYSNDSFIFFRIILH